MTAATRHVAIVEAYAGLVAFLSGDAAERESARGLGLPVAEIADALECRATVLSWDAWLRYETLPGSFLQWIPWPATRALQPPGALEDGAPRRSRRVERREIAARDPVYGLPFAEGLSPRSHGLLANSDPLFFASYCLALELAALHEAAPLHAVIVPMWGGSGYVAQMGRATGASPLRNVPFAVVVTDTSAHRHEANEEGRWTRPAVTRRQMEDLSLALADLALVFGPRGEAIALEGRLPESSPPVLAPRFVPPSTVQAVAAAAQTARPTGPVELFVEEPQDESSGVLLALDAVNLLWRKGARLDRPLVSGGPSVVLAPMTPRPFVEYWSSRGFVRELEAGGQWTWATGYPRPNGVLPVRVYPSRFEHLPNVWSELARGSFVLLSPAAAEGLAPGVTLPPEASIGPDCDPATLADRLDALQCADPVRLDATRRDLCERVAQALEGPASQRLLRGTTEALERLLAGPAREPLSRVAMALLDRRQPLGRIARTRALPAALPARPATRTGSLSVVVVCFDMGDLVRETVESVWRSERVPDELILVDDGSGTEETLQAIATLEGVARERGLPLQVLRQGNLGLAAARNRGLEAATGELVSFLDGDDLIEPAFYRLASALLQQDPDLGGVAAWADIFGVGTPDAFWNAPQPELPLLLVENTVFVPLMVRTEVLRTLGGYDVRQRYNYEDWELSVRLLASGRPIVTIPAYLQRYRVRSDSLLRTLSNVQNQGMREVLLETHRKTVCEFAVETAMLVESELMRRVYARPAAAKSPRQKGVREWLRKAASAGREALRAGRPARSRASAARR
jgi:Glycosyl transferase family 2